MQIEEQIKTLLRIKAKIDLYKKVIENISLEKTSKDKESETLEKEHPGLLVEFCGEIEEFCNNKVMLLSRGPSQSVKSPEALALPITEKETKSIMDPRDQEPADPLRFILKYKGLNGKRVTFTTKDGNVQGLVRGLVTPYVKVETDNGHIIDISPKELTILEK